MKNIISLILIGAAVWIFWGYSNPIYKETKGLREIRVDYKSKLAQANEFRQKYEELVAKYQSFPAADIARLSRLVPETVDTVRLVMDVNNIAVKQGLLIKNIKISELAKQNSSVPTALPPAASLTPEVARIGGADQGFNSVELNFSVTGSYERFVAFLQDLEKSLRILDVTTIKFATASDSAKGDNYDFSLSLKAYWLK